MDYVRFGLAFRAVRIRQGLRQSDVAARAGVSDSMVSRIERGDIGPVTIGTLCRVGDAIGLVISISVRWRGVELPRLLDERHAVMAREVVALLTSTGWEVRVEHTFNVRGEQGSIDVLAWHPDARAVLVVELKTLVPDLQAMLSTLDRKRRLAHQLAAELGWRPVTVAAVLVLPEQTQARNAVERHRGLLDSALPAHTRQVRAWLRRPAGDLRGILFLPNSPAMGAKRGGAGQIRVRKRMPARSPERPTLNDGVRDGLSPSSQVRQTLRSNPAPTGVELSDAGAGAAR